MLLDDLKNDMTASLKKGDKVRLETLRFLLAAVRNMAITKYGAAGESSVTDQDVLDVVKKQVKTHKESIEAFEKAGRTELFKQESEQLVILSGFLPKELSDEELHVLLRDVVDQHANVDGNSGQNFGLLMKAAMGKVEGRADGKRVSAMLRELMAANK